jgi:hypothetical protein
MTMTDAELAEIEADFRGDKQFGLPMAAVLVLSREKALALFAHISALKAENEKLAGILVSYETAMYANAARIQHAPDCTARVGIYDPRLCNCAALEPKP